jgi:FkbM family methyltransferase
VKKVHFIDCGANIGKAIDWAIEKHKDELIKVDAFEPEHTNYMSMMDKYLESKLDITIHKKAVWVKNTIRPFNIQFWGSKTGSSLMADKYQAFHPGQVLPKVYDGKFISYDAIHSDGTADDSGTKINSSGNIVAQKELIINSGMIKKNVQCLNFSEWVYKNLSKKNYNVLKIDIEGAEYEVIDHLLKTGAHTYIDRWLVEFTPETKIEESYKKDIVRRFELTVPEYTDWGPMGEVVMGVSR